MNGVQVARYGPRSGQNQAHHPQGASPTSPGSLGPQKIENLFAAHDIEEFVYNL